MKKIVLANIFLAAFLMVTGPALAADSEVDDLDVTIQLMEADANNPDMIINQIELPTRQQTMTRTRTQAMVMDEEHAAEADQLRTQTRTEEMQQLRDTTHTQMQDLSQDQSQELRQEMKQQNMPSDSGRRSGGGGNR